MNKEFKIAKGWGIFMYVFGPVLIVGMGFMGLFPLFEEPVNWMLFGFLFPIGLIFAAVFLIAMLDVRNARFGITEEKVYITSTLNYYCRTLFLDEIEGFREDDKYIYLLPKAKKKKGIKISTYYGGLEEIRAFVYEHFADVDEVSRLKDEVEILQDAELGRTVEEREEKLKRSRQAALILNWASGLGAAWIYFYPQPYQLAVAYCTCMFLLAILVLRFFPLMRVFTGRESAAHPTVLFAFLLTSFTLGIRAVLDFNMYDYTSLWLPATGGILVLYAMIALGRKEFASVKGALMSLILVPILLFLNFGVILIANGLYDTSTPEVFTVSVINKYKSSGKHTSYNLKLTAWGNREEGESVDVDRGLYESINEGEEANVYLYKGALNIPWFQVE